MREEKLVASRTRPVGVIDVTPILRQIWRVSCLKAGNARPFSKYRDLSLLILQATPDENHSRVLRPFPLEHHDLILIILFNHL